MIISQTIILFLILPILLWLDRRPCQTIPHYMIAQMPRDSASYLRYLSLFNVPNDRRTVPIPFQCTGRSMSSSELDQINRTEFLQQPLSEQANHAEFFAVALLDMYSHTLKVGLTKTLQMFGASKEHGRVWTLPALASFAYHATHSNHVDIRNLTTICHATFS